VELAGKYRLPAIYFQKEFVEAGGLMSYGVDYVDLYRRTAVYVDKILKGAKPADLPVQQATKFEFVINLKAAKQIGLTLSPEFLSRANQVIKCWKKTKLRCQDCIEFSDDLILQDATEASYSSILRRNWAFPPRQIRFPFCRK